MRSSAATLTLILVCGLVSLPAAQSAQEKTNGEKAWEQTLRSGVDALDSNKYWIAEPLLKKAAVEAGKFGMEDLRLAKAYAELGRLYTVRGRFADAEPWLEEELFIKKQALDREGDQLVPAMGSLIKFYLNYGSRNKADALSEEMLAIVEGKLQEAAHKPKAKVTRVNGKITLEGWAGVAAKTMRDPFIEWAISCDGVADAYYAQENYKSAERLYKAALEVKETVLGRKHLSLANSYDSLGELALARNDLFTAESDLKDAYEISSRILPNSNERIYSRLDKLAKCLIKAGKQGEAEQLYLSAQNFWPNDKPLRTSAPIRAKLALANLYCLDKNYEAAEPLLKKAMNDAQDYYGDCSVSLVPYIQRYAYVLYYLGQRQECDELKARAAEITGNVMIAAKPKKLADAKSPDKASSDLH